MAKRLRGYQLEKALQVPKKVLKKTAGSALATALLSLWCHGKVSGTTMRWLAESAILDGAQHEELFKIAKCGSHGLHPGNIHRDLMASFCKGLDMPTPFELEEVPCKNTKTLKKDEDTAAMLLPHQMFAKLLTYDAFEVIFPLEKVEQFWNQALEKGDDRFHGHPALEGRMWKKTTLPLFLHGDGVEYQTRDSLMIYSWGSLLQQMGSLSSHFYVASFPKSCTEPGTWDTMQEWICWSFAALQNGYHPSQDPWGKPLRKGSPFFLEKGKPLAKGLKGVLWSIQGDHEFFSNSLKLPHWASKSPCWECSCSKSLEKGKKMWYKTLEKGKQGWKIASHEECLKKPRSTHALFSGVIPGLSTKMVRGDCLHILFCKGVLGHLLGSIIHYFLYYDGVGVSQTVPPEKRLGAIFEAVQKEYVLKKISQRVTNLRLSMVCSPKEPHKTFPTLDLKGSETKWFLQAFAPVLAELVSLEKEHEAAMLEAVKNMAALIHLFDEADVFLTNDEWLQAMKLGDEFSNLYSYLSSWALEKGRNLFNIVMKHHTFQHLVQNSKFLNPKTHWTFSSEDFVGKMSILTASVSPGVSSTRLSLKVAPKYRILLHFLLTREGMQEAGKHIDP